MKKIMVASVLIVTVHIQTMAAGLCYGWYGYVPCGDPVGTRYENCPDFDDWVVTSRGSKPVWLAGWGSGGYKSLSSTAPCAVPIRVEPCDNSPPYDDVMEDWRSRSPVPRVGVDQPCGS
jgi:hypothetical protein